MSQNLNLAQFLNTGGVIVGNVAIGNATSNVWIFSSNGTLSVAGVEVVNSSGSWTGSGGGTKGEQGAKGDPGGQKGDKGDTGSTGTTGAKGDNGEVGAAGSKGDIGANGETGSKGEKGQLGDTGAKGDTGTAGATGDKGSTGTTGSTGDKGDKGDTGSTGTTGTAGAKGDTGTTGSTGDKGDKGDTGSTGAAGAKGDVGPAPNTSTYATLTDTQTLTNKTITGLRETKTTSSANSFNLSSGNYFTHTLSGATTFTVSNTASSGSVSTFILDLTDGGSATITWWSGMKWAGGTAPTLTTSGRDVLGFFTHDGGTVWNGLVLAKDIK